MSLEHPSRFTAGQAFLAAGVSIVAAALLLLLVGPRVWARGQINLFGLEAVRAWMCLSANQRAKNRTQMTQMSAGGRR